MAVVYLTVDALDDLLGKKPALDILAGFDRNPKSGRLWVELFRVAPYRVYEPGDVKTTMHTVGVGEAGVYRYRSLVVLDDIAHARDFVGQLAKLNGCGISSEGLHNRVGDGAYFKQLYVARVADGKPISYNKRGARRAV